MTADIQGLLDEATAQERRRIADGLHDDVLQHLLFARQELISADAGDGADMARASSSLTEGIRLLRAVVGDLHPLALSGRAPSGRGLSETVAELTREAQRPSLTTSSRLGPGIDSRHDALVASAVRELLANVVKHARASAAEVTVRAKGQLVIEVRDDGVGLDPTAMMQAVMAGHIGLASLTERVQASDGQIELTDHRVDDASGGGTLVRVSLPLP
jgi:two-component system NarL family sensor kinase